MEFLEQQFGRCINFSAGPAALPLEVLMVAQQEMLNYHGCGCSVMEMSHRSKTYEEIIRNAKADLKALLNVPDNYEILFLQGGGLGQFAAIPMNLLGTDPNAKIDFLVTGHWSKNAMQEAKKYCSHLNVVCSGEATNFTSIPRRASWKLSPDAAYIHYCSNETIHGVEFVEEFPDFSQECPNVPVVCDMSSDFLSRPVDVSRFGVIMAGAQKNCGPAGVCIVIVRRDLLAEEAHRCLSICPSVWNWKEQAKNESMLNTPPCYSIYMCGLYFKWLKAQGGLGAIQRRNHQKAEAIYQMIDGSTGFYSSPITEPSCRSVMNIPFRILQSMGGKPGEKFTNLEEKFLKEVEEQGMTTLRGHRSVGGLRASIYNAMTPQQVTHFVEFMRHFQQANCGH